MTLSDRLRDEAALDSTFDKARRLAADGDVLSHAVQSARRSPILPGSPMTLSDRLRDEAALDSTFDKARRLAADGDVLSCEVTPSQIDGVVRLSGLVRSSGPGAYHTSVTLDLNDEDVVTYQCACPAAETPSQIDGVVRLSGLVRSSGPGAYHTSVTLDLNDEDVVTYQCACPAAENYEGMCKHEIALALAYLGAAGPTGDPAAQAVATPTAPAVPSSSQISDLLSAITAQRVGAATAAQRARTNARHSPMEPVELLVTISPAPKAIYRHGSQTLALKLQVRSGKTTYVVKNVASLVQAWEEGAELSYGKNLTFVHGPEAFTAQARALLAVVARIVHSQQALFMSRYDYWSAGRGTDIKELPLSEADAPTSRSSPSPRPTP